MKLIKLTAANGHIFWQNTSVIDSITAHNQNPAQTVVHLLNGQPLLVCESAEEIAKMVND
jgi:uncharacterized protein YlzI (FlbEa/FlbD family)